MLTIAALTQNGKESIPLMKRLSFYPLLLSDAPPLAPRRCLVGAAQTLLEFGLQDWESDFEYMCSGHL